MGEAKDRGTTEDRAAAAATREQEVLDQRRREWAEDMVADAQALHDAAWNAARSRFPPQVSETAGERELYAASLASIAAMRAVAFDMLSSLEAGDDEDDEPPESFLPPVKTKSRKTPLKLVADPSDPMMPPTPPVAPGDLLQ